MLNAFQMKYMQHYMGSILEYAIALKNSKGKAMKKDKVFLKVGKKLTRQKPTTEVRQPLKSQS